MRAQLEVLGLIAAERERQDRKFPEQWAKFAELSSWSLKRSAVTPYDESPGRAAAWEMLGILTEEVGEVARAICDRDDDNFLEECVQVAAVATAMAEAIMEYKRAVHH